MPMNPTGKKLRLPFLLFLLVLLFYSYFFQFIGRESWNVSSRLNLTYALAEYGTFRIDAYHQNTGDKVFYRGHYYTDKAPGISLLAVPGYLFFKRAGVISERYMRYWLTLLTVGIPSALGALVFYGLTGIFGDLSPRVRLGTALAYSLGTLAFPFSTVFYGHQAAAAAGLAAFYILVRLKKTRGPEPFPLLFLSGFLAGYAFLSDFPAGIILVLLVIYAAAVLRRKPGFFFWGLGAALPVGFLLYYNNACFGSPIVSSYTLHQTYSHTAGFLGITLPRLDVLWGITFSPYRGLFYGSPVLLFAIPGFYLSFRRRETRTECLVCFLAVLGFLLFNAGYQYWDGVGSTGARFMIPALPFLALALARPARKWPLQFAVAAFISIAFMLVVAATDPRAEWRVRSPLFYFNFFLFLRGNLSDNLGRLFGLRGIFSLFPLLAGAGLLAAALGRISSRPRTRPEKRGNALRAAALGSMIILWVVSAGWEEPFLREVDKAESLFRYYRGRREVDWTEVEEYYQRAIEYEPRLIEPYLRLAEIARLRGWPRVALAYYRELAALYPESTEVLLEMALVHDLLGDPAAAEDLLLKAVELGPGEPLLREQLGAFYLYHGRPEEAILHLEEALQTQPGEGRIIRQLEEARGLR
jgi:tetratricopeptide (TPR) repeat protein